MNKLTATDGTQSMRRALGLLRVLAQHQEDGIDLQGVMGATGLERSTAHRLLSCLLEEQFAERDNKTRRYRLGVDSMQLGFAALRRTPLLDALRPFAQKLARLSGDTVFLVIRQGDYALANDACWAWAPAAWHCWPACRTRTSRRYTPATRPATRRSAWPAAP
ncbi:hypothetical protein G6F65_016869 [Rhizopus arrhizus]|nr:hypothetical protein G6F65_016869 [Rhizopus arrhizus]